jgi:hypothetical protein
MANKPINADSQKLRSFVATRSAAENFEALLARWIPLACAGGEDWQWLPFAKSKTSMLDSQCENAREFRSLLGLQREFKL